MWTEINRVNISKTENKRIYMKNIFIIYFKYTMIINIIFGLLVGVFSKYICYIFTDNDSV